MTKHLTKWVCNSVIFVSLVGICDRNAFAAAASEDSAYQIEKAINESHDKAAGLQLDKERLEQKIIDLQKKIRDRKIVLLKRASAMSHLKNDQFGALLARSESPAQLDRQLKIFERLSEYDIGLFKDYKSTLKMLSVSRQEMEKTILEITVTIEKLKAQQQDLVAKEAHRLKELTQNKIASLLKLKGRLARPLDGELSWHFGAHFDDAKQFVFVSKGFLYKTLPGKEIKAVGPGVIIFSDDVPHWRETLIIQHDDNYYSVYTGLQNPAVAINDTVEANQIIGTTDSDEFYFELRHFDNPINPKYWFKDSKEIL